MSIDMEIVKLLINASTFSMTQKINKLFYLIIIFFLVKYLKK